MTILQDYAEEIYATINGRKKFTIPWLQEGLEGNRTSGNFSRLIELPLVKLIEKAAGSRPAAYALEPCSLESFLSGLSVTEDRVKLGIPQHMIAVARFIDQPITNELYVEALSSVAEGLPDYLKLFNSTGPMTYRTQGMKTVAAVILQWCEIYESDPRSAHEDTRFALFTLGEQNGA